MNSSVMVGSEGLPPWARSAYRAFAWVKGGGLCVSGMAVFGMMVFIIADVVNRNLRGSSITGGYEIVQNYFMIASVFPAMGYVVATGILPRLDLAVQRMRRSRMKVAVQVGLIGEVVVLTSLIMYTFQYAVSGLERGAGFSAAGSIYPLWPVLFMIPAGFILAVIEVLFVILRNFTGGVVAFSMTPTTDLS